MIDPPIVFDVVSSAGVNATNTITWNHTVANQPNRMLLVSYNSENTGTASCQPSSVTYNGVAMTLAGQMLANTPSPNWDCVGIYYLLNPAIGLHAVSITFTAAPVNDGIAGAAMSVYSVSQNAPDVVATSQAAGLTSTNITTLWPNSWVIDAMGPGDLSGNLAVSAGQTSRVIRDSTGSNSIGMSSKLLAAAGATTMSWTRTPAPNRTGQVVVALSPLDNTAPSAPVLTVNEASPLSFVSGTTLYYNAQGSNTASFTVDATSADADSGIQKINFPAVTGMTGGGDDLTSPYQGAYTWNPATAASGAQTVTVTNGQGLTSTGTFTVTKDATNPTGSLTAPASSANVRGNAVVVSSNSADGGSGVGDATFQRSPAGAGTWTTIGAADTTSPYSVNWDTTAVADGLYDLRVITTDNVGNTFTSALVTNVRVDNTLPTNVLSLQSVAPAGSAFLNGNTVYYRGTAAGNFQLQNAVSDAGSGPASSVFPVLGGTVGTWTHTTQTVNTPAGGPYVTTNNFAHGAGEANSPTESVTSTDNAGNTSNATVLTFTNDSTNPTGAITAPASSANVRGNSVAVTSNSSDGGSGVASAQFQRSPAGAGTWTTIGAADTTSPYSVNWDTTAVGGRALRPPRDHHRQRRQHLHLRARHQRPRRQHPADQHTQPPVRLSPAGRCLPERQHDLLPRHSSRQLPTAERRRRRRLRPRLLGLPRARRHRRHLDAHHPNRQHARRRPLRHHQQLRLERRRDQQSHRVGHLHRQRRQHLQRHRPHLHQRLDQPDRRDHRTRLERERPRQLPSPSPRTPRRRLRRRQRPVPALPRRCGHLDDHRRRRHHQPLLGQLGHHRRRGRALRPARDHHRQRRQHLHLRPRHQRPRRQHPADQRS